MENDNNDDSDDEEDDNNAHETESKPKYLPPFFGNHVLSSTPILTGFPHPDVGDGAIVRPLPPEVALRLQLDFGQTDAVLSNVSPALPLAESSGASNSIATSSR